MKENNKHIDELFKSKLDQRTFDVPEAFVNDLTQRLDHQQKQRAYKKWYLGGILGLLCILTLGAVFYFLSTEKIAIALPRQVLSQNNTPSETENSKDTKVIRSQGVDSKSQSMNQQSTKTAPQSTSDSEYNANPTTFSLGQNTSDQKNKAFAETSTSIPSNSKSTSGSKVTPPKDSKSQSQSSESKQHLKQESNSNAGRKESANPVADSNKKESTSTNNSKPNPSQSQDSGKENNASEQASGKDQNDNTKGLSSEADSDNSNISFHITPSGDSIRIKDSVIIRDSVVIRDSIVIKDSIRFIDSVQQSSDHNSKFSIDVQLFAGGGFVSPSYKPENTLANESEKGIGVMRTGLYANFNYKNIRADLGIQYQKTGEKFDYTTTDVYTYQSVVLVGYDTIPIYDTMGNVIGNQTTPILDSVTYSESMTSESSTKNQYNWVTIPLHFGYQFNIKNWSITPKAGVAFHFGVANEPGKYYNPVTSNLETTPTRKFTMSYSFQLEIRKTFSHFHVFISPYYNGMFLPTHQAADFKRTYSSWGGQIGIGVPIK